MYVCVCVFFFCCFCVLFLGLFISIYSQPEGLLCRPFAVPENFQVFGLFLRNILI